jgi:hypothetical protein
MYTTPAMPHKFELPDDIAEDLERLAPSAGKKDAQDLLVFIADQWRTNRKRRKIENRMIKSYSARGQKPSTKN